MRSRLPHAFTRRATAAFLVALPGLASAAIAPPSSGNGELLLTVWDQTAGQSYTRDLGMLVSDFGPDAFIDPGFTLIWAPDPLLTDFLAQAQGNLMVWNVLAGDSGGSAGERALLSTAPATLTEAQLEDGNIGGLNQALTRLNQYTGALNGLETHASQADGAALASPADGTAYAGSGGFGDSLGGSLPGYVNTGALGQTLNFWQIERVQPAPGAGPGGFFALLLDFLQGGPAPFSGLDATAYGITAQGEFLHSTFTLMDDGTLVFAVPVPEADTLVLLAVGLAGIAWASRRRGQRAAATARL